MSAAAKRQPSFTPVSAARAKRLGLMERWARYCVPPGAGLLCWVCRRPAAYAAEPNAGMASCIRHARDF